MAAKFLTSQMHLKLELMHNKTCRTSRLLEIVAKNLMILISSLIKVHDNREILTSERFRKRFRKSENHWKSCWQL